MRSNRFSTLRLAAVAPLGRRLLCCDMISSRVTSAHRMKRIALLLLASFTAAGTTSLARDLPDVNRQQLIAELEKMESDRKQQWEFEIKKVIAEIAAASQSPVAATKMYQEAVRATQAGKKNDDDSGARRNARAERQEDMQGSSTFKLGMQFRLRYMAMLLRTSAGEDPDALFPELERYVDDILADKKLMEDRQSFQVWGRGIGAEDPIVQMFRLEPYLKAAKGWGMVPGNVDGMIDGVLMPKYRDKKDPKLMAFWDDKIERQREKVEEAGLEMGKQRFETEELPRLLWSRAKDYAHMDEPNRALTEMIAIIRQHPGHPDFERWIGELKAELKVGS